jgi:mannose-6-phosphate isomerase class I
MKGHMGLDPSQPNYAWSFELIVPENGIVLERDGQSLEFSFDCLMFAHFERVLGREAGAQFKYEWPIRLDYLDTIDGGDLSTQCHPRPDYIRREFGETITQDETYYIVNAKPDARVYLGLTDACDPAKFRAVLEESQQNGTEVDVEAFVHSEPSKPHDLFSIPNGTVHCSGRGNLVLEISATPYIFTFKIYDYLRRDLDGNLRAINISRAFDNIRFERRRQWVQENLVARRRVLRRGPDWEHVVLMDRPEVFYEIHRIEFANTFELETEDRGFAANLVAGEEITLSSANGHTVHLHYLESMIIPAASKRVRMVNQGHTTCMLVLVFVRPGTGSAFPLNNPGN